MRNRQRDYMALKDQYNHLQDQYRTIQMDRQRLEAESLDRINNDSHEIDRLLRELELAKQENLQAEDEQQRLLAMIN